MTKTIMATCVGGVVKAGTIVVTGATLLSEGVGASEGVLLIDREGKTYLAKTSPDLMTSLDKLTMAIDKTVEVITAIGAGMTGPTTAPPPTLGVQLAQITAISTELKVLKGALK